MKTSIDAAGRVVIPKRVREAAHLEPGTILNVRFREGVIELEPSAREVRLEPKGMFTVATPTEVGPPLSDALVQAARVELSDGRG